MKQYYSIREFAKDQAMDRFDGPACILMAAPYMAEGVRFDVRIEGKNMYCCPVRGKYSSIPSLSGQHRAFFTE